MRPDRPRSDVRRRTHGLATKQKAVQYVSFLGSKRLRVERRRTPVPVNSKRHDPAAVAECHTPATGVDSDAGAQRADAPSPVPVPAALALSPSGEAEGEPPPAEDALPPAVQNRYAAAALAERAERMFLLGAEAPVASGGDAVAKTATYGLILAAVEAVEVLWKQRGDEIRQRCAPTLPTGLIDKQEMLGYVLADALGRPLLPPEAARPVGRNGGNAATTAAKQLKAARRAAAEARRARKRTAEKVKSAEDAVAAVLDWGVELKLPYATVGRKRAASAAGEAPAAAQQAGEAARMRREAAQMRRTAQSARDAVLDAEDAVAAAEAAEQWRRLNQENEQLRADNELLCAERDDARRRAAHWRSLFLNDGEEAAVEAHEDASEAEDEVWDEATAARAQAEMLAAHRARPPKLWQLYSTLDHGPEALREAALRLRSAA